VDVTQVDIPTHPLKDSNCHDMGPLASPGRGGLEHRRRPRWDGTEPGLASPRTGSTCGPSWSRRHRREHCRFRRPCHPRATSSGYERYSADTHGHIEEAGGPGAHPRPGVEEEAEAAWHASARRRSAPEHCLNLSMLPGTRAVARWLLQVVADYSGRALCRPQVAQVTGKRLGRNILA
jgi:hypothetical protein